MTRQDAISLALVLTFATLFVAHKFDNQFVYDDVLVINADLIHEPGRIGEVFATHAMVVQGDTTVTPMDTYRPLTLVTFFWDAWLSGHDPWAYHLTNHLLHLAVVTCVFILARTLLPAAGPWTAGTVALFFALSPQLAEGHVWINGRSDPLATLFGLLSLIMWRGKAEASTSSTARRLGAAALFFAGLLCKEVLLFAIPALVLMPSRTQPSWSARFRAVTPFAIAGAGYLALRAWALQGMHASRGADQVLQAIRNLPVLWMDGLRELLSPSRLYLRNMRDEYGLLTDGQRLLIVTAAAACALMLFLLRKRMPILAWGMTWYACTLAPAAMISCLLWLGFGRYLYMPCAGLALGLGEVMVAANAFIAKRFATDERRARLARRGGAVVVVTYLLSFGAGLAVVTQDYADNETLYSAAALASPTPAYAYAWHGTAIQAQHPVRAIPLHEKAVALDPTEPRYLHDLVVSYMKAGRFAQAERAARRGIAAAPKNQCGDLRALLIQVIAGTNPRAAVVELCECLRFQPDYKPCAAAPRWMLDPRGPRAAEFRHELTRFEGTCPSPAARAVVTRTLRSLGISSALGPQLP